VAALPLVLAVGALAGCGSGDIEPGPDAANPACSALIRRLPPRVVDRGRTKLDVAGAASWGDPPVVLRCGVPPSGPTTDPCVEADGLDWTFTETRKTLRLLSYGRTPAVEVQVPTSVGRQGALAALVDLAGAVRPIPTTTRCIGPDDA
jgi:Protein of unknown function (DUF3515)